MEDNGIVTKDVIDDNDSTLLVNSATGNKINPGDIRKLMSTPSKDNPSPSSTKKVSWKPETNINGKIYREVGKHIICYLFEVSHSLLDYLVDTGANSALVGNDVRVIAKHSDRTADVRGIDNHEKNLFL